MRTAAKITAFGAALAASFGLLRPRQQAMFGALMRAIGYRRPDGTLMR